MLISTTNYIMNKKIKQAYILVPILAFFLLISFKGDQPYVDLKPDDSQANVSRLVVKMITTANYKKVTLNDSVSSLIFDRYLKSMDGTHIYLLNTDVSEFEKLRSKLDDDLITGDLDDAFFMFNTFRRRYNDRWVYALSLLDGNIDLSKKETYTYNRKDLPFITSAEQMDAQWAMRVKYDLLNLKLAGGDLAKNKEVLRKRYQNFLDQSDKLNSQDVFQMLMNAFTGAIDPHTNYFTPSKSAEYGIKMARALEGIGATLASENEYITIKSITVGGPAYKTGLLKAEDRILAVAQGKEGEFQDIVGWRMDNAINLIRGLKGTIVRLKVLSKGKSNSDVPKIIEVIREKIILEEMSAKKEVKTYFSNGKEVKIGIIKVPSFYLDFADFQSGNPNYKSTTRDVKLILDTLKATGVDGVVVDLRDNGGGSLHEAISLTGLFIRNGPVVQVRDSKNEVRIDNDEDNSISYDGPLAVLLDRFSASASEIFAGAIQDYGRGIILGTQSYGKGTVQTPVDLDKLVNKAKVAAGSLGLLGQLNLTVGKFYRINGSSTQLKGVIPDIQLPSLIPIANYGENTEPAALPWDTIAKSGFTAIGGFSTTIPQLQKLHRLRAQKSPANAYFADFAAQFRKNEAITMVVLDEQQLRKQREANETKSLLRDNLLRRAMNLPDLKMGQVATRTEDLDFTKREAGQILTDYILMKH